MQGLHLTADLFDCRDPRRLMADVTALRGACETLTREAGLAIVVLAIILDRVLAVRVGQKK